MATKLAIEKYGEVVIYYTDPGQEHPDNPRFLADCEKWFGQKITTLKSDRYEDALEVCESVRYLSSDQGAPCTSMMKKIPGGRVWEPGDVEIFGYTDDELDRLQLWKRENNERIIECPLIVEWPFFWVFPSAKESRDPESGIIRRHHIHDKSFAKAVRPAVRRADLDKRVTAHSFRHGFATAYLMAGGNIRELQDRMGHESIETTMRYLHCLPNQFDRIGSPWDIPQLPVSADILRFPRTA